MARTIVVPLSDEEILEIKSFIRSQGISQDALGEKLGVKRGTVSRWFRKNQIAAEARARLMKLIDECFDLVDNYAESYPALFRGFSGPKMVDLSSLDRLDGLDLEMVSTECLVDELQGRGWTVALTKRPD